MKMRVAQIVQQAEQALHAEVDQFWIERLKPV